MFQKASSPAEHVALIDKMKGQISPFNSNSDVRMYEELIYSEYDVFERLPHIPNQDREYEGKVVAAHRNVEGLRVQYMKTI